MTAITMNNPIRVALLLPLISVLLVASVRSEQSSSSSSSSLRGLNTDDVVLPTKTLRIIGGEKSELGRFPYYALMDGGSLCGKFKVKSSQFPRRLNVLYHSQSLTHSFSFYIFILNY
jgi:hypothetical protein